MNSVSIRVILGVFVSIVGAFIFSLFTTMLAVPEDLLPEFRDVWVTATISSKVLRNFPIAVISGVFLVWSVFIDKNVFKRATGAGKQFSKLIQPALVMALVVTAVYFLALGLIEGPALHSMRKAQADSDLARYYHSLALKALEEGNPRLANEENKKTVMIAPKWSDSQKLHDTITGQIKNLYTVPEKKVNLEKPLEILDWDILDTQARKAAEQGDLFSALYYAESASKAGTVIQKAKSEILITELTEKIGVIESFSLSGNELTTYELKQRAILGQYRQGAFIDSYYTLKILEKQAPDDRELAIWMPKILESLQAVSFFREEYEEALGHASPGSVMVQFPQADGHKLIVSASRLFRGRHSYYATELDVMELDSENKILRHVHSALVKFLPGKVEGESLLLTRSMNKNDPSSVRVAEFLAGEAKEGENNLFTLAAVPELLWTVAGKSTKWNEYGLFDLYPLLKTLEAVSWDIGSLHGQIISRFLEASSILVFWFFGMALGWGNRSRYAVVPILLTIPMLLILPFVIYICYETFVYVLGLLTQGAVISFGFWPAAGLGLGLLAVSILVSLFYLAMQKSE